MKPTLVTKYGTGENYLDGELISEEQVEAYYVLYPPDLPGVNLPLSGQEARVLLSVIYSISGISNGPRGALDYVRKRLLELGVQCNREAVVGVLELPRTWSEFNRRANA